MHLYLNNYILVFEKLNHYEKWKHYPKKPFLRFLPCKKYQKWGVARSWGIHLNTNATMTPP